MMKSGLFFHYEIHNSVLLCQAIWIILSSIITICFLFHQSNHYYRQNFRSNQRIMDLHGGFQLAIQYFYENFQTIKADNAMTYNLVLLSAG
jgi:hypothetical protein